MKKNSEKHKNVAKGLIYISGTLALAAVVLLLRIFLYNETIKLFPGEKYFDRIHGFTDSSDHGLSEISELSFNAKRITFSYRLINRIEYPYVGLSFILNETEKEFVNLASYSCIKLRLSASVSRKATLVFQTFIPGKSDIDKYSTMGLFSNDVLASGNPDDVKGLEISLGDFSIPSWWYDISPLKREEMEQYGLKYCNSFEIHLVHRDYPKSGENPETLIIEEISFHSNNILFCILTALAVIIYLVILVMLKSINIPLLSKWKIQENHIRNYQQLDLKGYEDEELKKILTLIKTEYKDASLSPQMVYEKTGIPTYKIPKLLKRNTGVSFSHLVNRIRLTEAKRLLRETDRFIIDIAFLVGFNSQAYFNKLFKDTEGISPNQYRKKMQLAIKKGDFDA